MDRQKPVADRIRPILEAMERSIDSARRKRCNNDPTPTPPSNRPNGSHESGADLPHPSSGDESPPRLKARPKRPMNLGGNNGGPNGAHNGGWRSAS